MEVVNSATLQIGCLIEQSQLEDVLGQIEILENENSMLKQKLQHKNLAQTKVFSYLHNKVLDSNEQLNFVESKFISDKKKLEIRKDEIRCEIQLLESNKNNDWNEADGENQKLRDRITTLNQYEKEMSLLDKEKITIEQALEQKKQQQLDEISARLSKHDSAKRHAKAVAKADIEMIAQRALNECDNNLDLKTKLLLEENEVIVQELDQQLIGVSSLENRVIKIEANNSLLRAKLKKAKQAENTVAQIMHLRQQELKELMGRVEEISSSSYDQTKKPKKHQLGIKFEKSQNFEEPLSKHNNKNNKDKKKNDDSKPILGIQNNAITSHDSGMFQNKTVLLDNYNAMLWNDVNEKTMQIKQRMEMMKKDKLRSCLKEIQEQNLNINKQIEAMETNFEEMMQYQQGDEQLTVILGIAEDFYNHHSSNSARGDLLHSSTSSMRSFFDDDNYDDDDHDDNDNNRDYFRHIKDKLEGNLERRYQGEDHGINSSSPFSSSSSSSSSVRRDGTNSKNKNKLVFNFLNMILSQIQTLEEARKEPNELKDPDLMHRHSLPSIWT